MLLFKELLILKKFIARPPDFFLAQLCTKLTTRLKLQKWMENSKQFRDASPVFRIVGPNFVLKIKVKDQRLKGNLLVTKSLSFVVVVKKRDTCKTPVIPE